MTRGLTTIALLVVSNTFMTLAWYGHLRFKEIKGFDKLGLFAVIAVSWGIAFFEYCAQVPANRLGFNGNGGLFNLIQLKVIQEVVSLIVFSILSTLLLKASALHWNHFAAFGCLVGAVYSQWGLIPRPLGVNILKHFAISRVVNPTVNNFLTERTSSIL